MVFDFFGNDITKEKVIDNANYAVEYKKVLNKRLSDGYVPLQRILYFYLEDNSLTIDTLYKINQNSNSKNTKEISIVCDDNRIKNLKACSENSISINKNYLIVSSKHFNFPLKDKYSVTGFFNEQRIVYDEENVHSGWDFATSAKTPIYSVCSGTVYKISFTQEENIPYDESNNYQGNSIIIKCDEDYENIFYVTFLHLYPNSSKVKVGDRVEHWTELASVGTTGYSTGNHLHYQVQDEKWNLLDGMQFIDFNI
ncbi:MAG: M23 family metallopeptidase [Bacilli bacterium]|nr:M23 family metallopeptidase [Bacilli bacterium]